MNHARSTACNSVLKISTLKNTSFLIKSTASHNQSFKRSYFFKCSGSCFEYAKRSKISVESVITSPRIYLKQPSFSFSDEPVNSSYEKDDEDNLVNNILSGMKATQLERQNKHSIFYPSDRKDKNKKRITLSEGPGLSDFLLNQNCNINAQSENVPYIQSTDGNKQKVYLEIYGCQMNFNDAEIVSAILKRNNYEITTNMANASIVLLVTCAIRDSAEQKIWNKLKNLRHLKQRNIISKVGLLGCMAERLKQKIIEEEKIVDIVAGPDSYKDLPRLLAITNDHETAINVALSLDETYADVTPVRLNPDSKTAFVSIMRGCDNMCTYCIVPFTRGRERSRPIASILDEVIQLSDQGIKEVTLLGQNVNSYRDLSERQYYENSNIKTNLARGFKTVYRNKEGGLRFSDLLDKVSLINPEMRIRFTSPHPKDFPDEVLQLIAERPNICRQIHLPAQSGNTAVLTRMRRGYTREAYLDLVYRIRSIISNVALSSDFIVGFCNETEEEFHDTLSLVEEVKYSSAYLFAYSMREKTTAYRRYTDNVDRRTKIDRLQKLIKLYRTEVENLHRNNIGQQQLVLVEGKSKRSPRDLQGRNDENIKVIFPNEPIPASNTATSQEPIEIGDYVVVHICNANSQILRGIPLYHSSISEFCTLSKKLQTIKC